MAGGLIALLDDVAALAKLAAASADDVAAGAARAGVKAAGVVIDDTAVTPRYVVGLSPHRELPIIGKIALGSLRNKLLFILPVAIGLSAFAPWAITQILMAGGAYLCFEAAEKIWEALSGHHHGEEAQAIDDPARLEERQVGGAIRTDFILSAEIMAIALAELPHLSIVSRALALAMVGVAITIGVYGVVALIVKMDDIGLHLSKRTAPSARVAGRGLIRAMPVLLQMLSHLGVAAMVWVGGGIIVHGMAAFGFTTIPHALHHLAQAGAAVVPAGKPLVAWLIDAIGAAIVGLICGALIVAGLHVAMRRKQDRAD